MKSKRALRFGGCGAALVAVYFGIAASAMASTDPHPGEEHGRLLGDEHIKTVTGYPSWGANQDLVFDSDVGDGELTLWLCDKVSLLPSAQVTKPAEQQAKA